MKIEYTIDCDGMRITQRMDTDDFGLSKPDAFTTADSKNNQGKGDTSQSAMLGSPPTAQPTTDRPPTPGPRTDLAGGEPDKKDTGGGPPRAGIVFVFAPIVCLPGRGDKGGGDSDKKGTGGQGPQTGNAAQS